MPQGGRAYPRAAQLAHMGPVLLFDVSVIVFLVGPPSGKLNVVVLAVLVEVVVEELRAVVRIDAAELEWHMCVHLDDGIKNARLPLAHYGFCLNPRGMDISEIE